MANDIKSSFGCFERFRTAESLLVLYCLQQDVEGRMAHVAMVVAVNLVQACGFVPTELHHAPHISVLFIASEQLGFGIARYKHEGRTVGAHMVERCETVDEWLQIADAVHVAIGEMTDHLSAEGHKGFYAVCIDTIACEPLFVEAKHRCDVATGRMARHLDAPGVATIVCHVLEHPCHGGRTIVQTLVNLYPWQQTIVYCHNGQPLLLQLIGNIF